MDFKNIFEELAVLKLRKNMEREIEDYFESKGFNIIEPDTFQSYDEYLLSNQSQARFGTVKVLGSDSEIFILRPDITTNILDKIFSNWDGHPPLKVYYNSKVYSNSHGGKINQSYQVGIEYLGDGPAKSDKEVLEMTIDLLDYLKTPYILEIGSSKYLDSYLKELKLNPPEELEIRNLIRTKNRDELMKKIKGIESKNILKVILDLEGNIEDVTQAARKEYMNDEMKTALDSIIPLIDFFKEKDLQDKVKLDLSMLPDMDYYDGIVFKGYCQGISKKILSGGRYDKLTEKFEKKVSAIGFMMDMDIATQIKYGGN